MSEETKTSFSRSGNEQIERIVKLETKVELLERDFKDFLVKFDRRYEETNEKFKEVGKKLDDIRDIVSAGRGAWKTIAVLSALILFVFSVVTSIRHFADFPGKP